MNNQISLIVYDKEMNKVAFLENAYRIGYEMPINGLWSATFTLPAEDKKNNECNPLNFVELYDNDQYIGTFRILTSQTNRTMNEAAVTYRCEHVLATLLDDVLFQFHTVGGTDIQTGDVIEYLLSKQSTMRWQLGTCDYNYQFEYTWENDNLLGALFSVPKPFLGEYQWTWNTQVYPWQLNLVQAPREVESYIRYGVNMQGIRKQVDPSELCTRLYCLGYGEGINQLTINDVNGGLPYLESDTVDQYGTVTKTFIDRSIENAEMLKAKGQVILEQSKHPRYTYSVDASELYAITKDTIDKFKTGTQVRVIDEELDIDIIARVVNYSKGDILGNPSAISLEIANKTEDIASSLANLEAKQRINETHAQGSTNINVYNLAENCDSDHPARFRVWIPQEAVRINKVLLTYTNEPFRANSKAVESAPAITSGSSSRTTTLSGGGQTVSFAELGTVNYGRTAEASFIKTAEGHYHEIHDFTLHLDPHVHDMEHVHEIASHTHDIQFGIYEGTTASNITLKVDNTTVSEAGTSETNLDLVDYLELDSEGKIKRGQFHEITIIPNRNSRIVATVVIQFFVQSRGGGNY